MSLNVKNAETLRLVADLSQRLGTSQTEAIRRAAAAQLAELDAPVPDIDALLAAIWAAQADDEAAAVRQRAAHLYDEAGLPA